MEVGLTDQGAGRCIGEGHGHAGDHGETGSGAPQAGDAEGAEVAVGGRGRAVGGADELHRGRVVDRVAQGVNLGERIGEIEDERGRGRGWPAPSAPAAGIS